jgi:outer membrane protein TolC
MSNDGPFEGDLATAALAWASAAAQSAEENYHKAQLDAAAPNLRRQRQLLALGSAHKSDVARAEEKLAKLQHDDQAPR